MSNQEHASSLPQINVVDSRNSTERNFCEASLFGIRCAKPTTLSYPISGDVRKYLCNDCLYRLVRSVRKVHEERLYQRYLDAKALLETGGAA